MLESGWSGVIYHKRFMLAELALKSRLWMCNYKSEITCLSSDPVQSPFANLEPPRKTFTHRFRDEDKSFLFKDTGVVGCNKLNIIS